MKLRTVITTATTAAVLSTAGIALAGASTSSTGTSSTGSTQPASTSTAAPKASKPSVAPRRARRHHRVRAFIRKVVLETIGIDRATLRSGLRNGQTIGEIATAHNVQPSAVVDALVTAANSKLDAAVTAGKITAERAHKIEARLPARFTKLVNSWHPRRLRNATPEARQ
ncbi:MAG: hypothetical protein QOG50_957 [Actinomycetota bacterium]|jgi:hypothetical protein|nr:hypothetical protein [Actinomycetota bacterium]